MNRARRSPRHHAEAARADALGIAAGYALDRWFGDCRRGHPVAVYGGAADRLRRAIYRDSRTAGVLHTTLCVGAVTTVAAVVARRLPAPARAGLMAASVWAPRGGTTLARTGGAMAGHLDAGGLAAARTLLPALCGRDPDALDVAGIARATCESLAENTADATVAPLLWAAAGGPAGALGYRAVNTLDSMVGYRSPRWRRFGWAAARLDDVVNFVPARVTGLLTIGVAAAVGPPEGGGGGVHGAVRAWRRDAPSHPSPNAGVVEATAAGALGVTLGGRTEYAHGVEERPRLGEGPAPQVADLPRFVRLSLRVQDGAAVLAVAGALVRWVLARRAVRSGGCRWRGDRGERPADVQPRP